MIGTLPFPINRILIGLVVMIFTASLLIPYVLIIIEHTQARLLTTTELREFVDSYSSTPEWALSAISVPILALIIGSDQSVYVDAAILLLLVFPAVYYLNQNFPFGLWVTIDPSKISSDDGIYTVNLYITTGSNIDAYFLDIDVPDGAEIQGFQAPTDKHRLTDEGRIRGRAPIDKDDFMVSFTIKETSGVGYNNILQVFDLESDRRVATVELE